MNTNEIRDYVERAPRRRHMIGQRLVNNTRARFLWLADLAKGTLDERINRRAGVLDTFRPWAGDLVARAQARHARKIARKGNPSGAARMALGLD